MKNNYWYIMLLAFFICAVSFVVIKFKNKQQAENNTMYPLLLRKDNSTRTEWLAAKKNADNLITKIKADPADTKSALALANTYIMEARITGNTVYYDKAAMKTVDNVLIREPRNYEALLL